MRKILILVILFFYTLQARENPFFFESNLKQLPYTSNVDKNLPPLHRAAITLPSKARTIEKVTITYKTLDGSVEEKEIVLGNSIDWHIPIFISQNYMDGEVQQEVQNDVIPTEDKVKQTEIKKVVTANFQVIAKKQYIQFLSLDKQLKLITKSKKIRDFLLVKPHRIVIDFRKKSEILSFVKKIPNNIFKKIVIGNHSGYYRVVIELDGYYEYQMKQTDYGYLITLK